MISARRCFCGSLTAAVLLGLAAAARAEPVTVTFLHCNDVYEIAPVNGQGGFAPFMTLLHQERTRNPNSVTTFGGDLISPSVLSGLTKGEQMVELMGDIGVQLAVPGNHEYDFGPAVAEERFKASRFQWLGTNVLGPDGKVLPGLADLVADAVRARTNAQAAIINGGNIRGDRTYPAGTAITRKDVMAELPFGNVVVLLELDGKTVKDALENGVAKVEDGAGRFPQVSGMSYTYDPRRPTGQRIRDVKVGGQPLRPDATYRVAVNDYMAGGGDGYAMLTGAKRIIDASGGTLMTSAVMGYVASLGGKIAPAVEGRIVRAE